MSPELIAFLKVWHDWATNGAPELEPYWRASGLCGNAMVFGDYGALGDELFAELCGQFSDNYPFGADDYGSRFGARTQHECPKRLAWVRERLIEAGELVA